MSKKIELEEVDAYQLVFSGGDSPSSAYSKTYGYYLNQHFADLDAITRGGYESPNVSEVKIYKKKNGQYFSPKMEQIKIKDVGRNYLEIVKHIRKNLRSGTRKLFNQIMNDPDLYRELVKEIKKK